MRTVIVGAGGHARSVIAALRSAGGRFEPVACTDPDPARHGGAVEGVPVLGDDRLLASLHADGVGAACLGLGGVGNNRPRAELHTRVSELGFELPPVVHNHAHVATSATVGAASVVLAGALVCPGVSIGKDVIVGSGAILEHDSTIGDHAHLASGCVLGGCACVATGAHVGLGAVVLQGRCVGSYALVGAGAVVVHEVTCGETVVGCPAAALTQAGDMEGSYGRSSD
jgi:UDP-perosamine 4-acetyltransferase